MFHSVLYIVVLMTWIFIAIQVKQIKWFTNGLKTSFVEQYSITLSSGKLSGAL